MAGLHGQRAVSSPCRRVEELSVFRLGYGRFQRIPRLVHLGKILTGIGFPAGAQEHVGVLVSLFLEQGIPLRRIRPQAAFYQASPDLRRRAGPYLRLSAGDGIIVILLVAEQFDLVGDHSVLKLRDRALGLGERVCFRHQGAYVLGKGVVLPAKGRDIRLAVQGHLAQSLHGRVELRCSGLSLESAKLFLGLGQGPAESDRRADFLIRGVIGGPGRLQGGAALRSDFAHGFDQPVDLCRRGLHLKAMQLLFRRGKRGQVLHQRALVGRQRAAAFPGGEDGIGALKSDLTQSGDAFVCRVDAKSRLGLFQQRRIFQRLLFFLGQRLVRLTGPGNGVGVGSVC